MAVVLSEIHNTVLCISGIMYNLLMAGASHALLINLLMARLAYVSDIFHIIFPRAIASRVSFINPLDATVSYCDESVMA